MYRKNNPHQMEFQNFYLPFGGELSGDNRWVILAEQIRENPYLQYLLGICQRWRIPLRVCAVGGRIRDWNMQIAA